MPDPGPIARLLPFHRRADETKSEAVTFWGRRQEMLHLVDKLPIPFGWIQIRIMGQQESNIGFEACELLPKSPTGPSYHRSRKQDPHQAAATEMCSPGAPMQQQLA